MRKDTVMKKNSLRNVARKITCGLLALACLASVSEISASGQTLEERVAEALRDNPGLKAKGLEQLAAREKIRQAGSPPDPQLSLGFYPQAMERYMGDQALTASVMQMFPWFGTLGAAKSEASAMAEMKNEEYREARNRLIFDVRRNWYSLLLARKEARLARENLVILKTLENIALVRFGGGGNGGGGSGGGGVGASPPAGKPTSRASGGGGGSGNGGSGGMGGMGAGGADSREGFAGGSAGSGTGSLVGSGMGGMSDAGSTGDGGGLADLLRIRLEIAEQEERLASLEEEARVTSVRSNRLLGRSPERPVIPLDTLEAMAQAESAISPDADPDAVLAENPTLKMLESGERAFASQETMNRRMGMPMVGVGLQYERLRAADRAGAMGGDMLMPMVSVTLPLWRGKYTGAVREAARMREATAEARIDAALELRTRFEEARRERDDAARRIALYEAQAGRAQAILNILMSRYAAGGENIGDVLGMRQTLLEYRLQLSRAIVDNNTAIARLKWLKGDES